MARFEIDSNSGWAWPVDNDRSHYYEGGFLWSECPDRVPYALERSPEPLSTPCEECQQYVEAKQQRLARLERVRELDRKAKQVITGVEPVRRTSTRVRHEG